MQIELYSRKNWIFQRRTETTYWNIYEYNTQTIIVDCKINWFFNNWLKMESRLNAYESP